MLWTLQPARAKLKSRAIHCIEYHFGRSKNNVRWDGRKCGKWNKRASAKAWIIAKIRASVRLRRTYHGATVRRTDTCDWIYSFRKRVRTMQMAASMAEDQPRDFRHEFEYTDRTDATDRFVCFIHSTEANGIASARHRSPCGSNFPGIDCECVYVYLFIEIGTALVIYYLFTINNGEQCGLSGFGAR